LDGESARYKASAYTQQHNRVKRGHIHISMLRGGFETTTPVFERSKSIGALDARPLGWLSMEQCLCTSIVLTII